MPEEKRYDGPMAAPGYDGVAGAATLSANVPKPPSEVDSQVSELHMTLTTLHKVIHNLSNKLEPVLDLRERPSDPKPKELMSSASQLGQSIASKRAMAQEAVDLIIELTSRITV